MSRRTLRVLVGSLAMAGALSLNAAGSRAAPPSKPAAPAPAPPAPAPAAPARSAEAILDDHAKAMGGPQAFARHKSVHMKRAVTVQGMGMNGTEERWATSSGQMLSLTTLPGVGTVRQGSTGKVRWSEDPINGLRVLKGAEDEEIRIESAWDAELHLGKLYKKVRAVAAPEGAPAGVECVELQPAIAEPSIACFDAKTHMRVFQAGKHTTPQGVVPYQARVSEWRDVEGMKVPFREEVTAGPMTIEAKLTEVKFDEPISASMFKMPKPGASPAGSAPAAAPKAPASGDKGKPAKAP